MKNKYDFIPTKTIPTLVDEELLSFYRSLCEQRVLTDLQKNRLKVAEDEIDKRRLLDD